MRHADLAATRRPELANDPSPAPEIKSRRCLSLPVRLILVVSVTIAVIYAGIVSPFRAIIMINVRREAEAMLREQAQVLQALVPREKGAVAKTLAAVPMGVFSMQLVDTNGVTKLKSGPLAGELPLPAGFANLVQSRGGLLEDVITRSRQRIRVFTTYLDLPGSPDAGEPVIMQLGLSLQEKYQRSNALVGWLVTGGVLLVLLPGAAMFLILTQWKRQFRDFYNHVNGLNLSRPPHPLLPLSNAEQELRELTEVFNGLITQMEKGYAAQQRFIADASHEIRTPLTILRGELDVILRRDREAAEYREVMQSNREEIEKLSRLVDNMLTLAHADAQEAVPHKQVVNLAVAAGAACQRLQPLAGERSVTLECSSRKDCTVIGEESDLERAILNLIENALHFSRLGEAVVVAVTSNATHGIVSVTDRGPGIAPDAIGRIFDRFYRVDKAHSRAHGGAGLGLAIVKTIAEAHGGTVEVESQRGVGSTFRLRLPLQTTERTLLSAK